MNSTTLEACKTARLCAIKQFNLGNEVNSWYWLLWAADRVWRPERSEKQQQVTKLWQQRGLLSRTKTNLKSIRILVSKGGAMADNLLAAEDTVQYLIEYNEAQMKNIK